MSEAERLADLMDVSPKVPGFIEYSATTIHEAAAELRRLSVESEMRLLALQDEMQKNKCLTAELEALKKAMGEPVAEYVVRVDSKGKTNWICYLKKSGYSLPAGTHTLYAIPKDKP